MEILDYMERDDYEQVVFCCDSRVGLKAIVAIHDTTLGPALGGARMRPYKSEEEAIHDALRLARAMTLKSSAAGLNLGGGKAVIIGNPAADKTDGMFRSLGRFIESLGGRYITTEDVGTTERDMENIRMETAYVTGLSLSHGSSGDPSPATAHGIYHGMRACLKEVFGSDALKGRTVAIQGVGKVGYHLARHLHDGGATLIVTDVDREASRRAERDFGATAVAPGEIYDVPCDVFSPCALGAVLNQRTIPRLKCRIVAGAANNQLEQDTDGDLLCQRDILYAPDYIINAGGVINLSLEIGGKYDRELALARLAEVYHTVAKVIARAKSDGVSTARVADRLAQERVEEARRARRIYLKR